MTLLFNLFFSHPFKISGKFLDVEEGYVDCQSRNVVGIQGWTSGYNTPPLRNILSCARVQCISYPDLVPAMMNITHR